MKYLDFDLAIEPSGDGFVARVLGSPSGEATADFSAPFSDLEIENFLLRMGRTRGTVRRIESPEMASAKLFGGRLFNSVFAGDVRGCLRSSIDEANRQGVGLRVRLHLGKAPALADLPWEFLYNASMNRFLGLSVETPVVRFLELPERIRPLTVTPPLRVLMMISSPTDYPQLDVTRESAKMAEALADLERGGIHLDRLRVRGFPFHDAIADFIADHDHVFVVEQNRDAQLKMLLVNECGIAPDKLTSILHYDGTPITARFIAREIGEKARVFNVAPLRKVAG
jgi:hypothetical protein